MLRLLRGARGRPGPRRRGGFRLVDRAARAPDRSDRRGGRRRARAHTGRVRARQPGSARPALGAHRAGRPGAARLARQAPYDRVLVSAEPRALPGELVEQLTDDGRMVIPVSGTMLLVRARRRGPRSASTAGTGSCRCAEPPYDLTRVRCRLRRGAGPARVGRQLPRRDRARCGVRRRGRPAAAARRALPLQRAPAHRTPTPSRWSGSGITAVYDLRTDHEVEAHPDVAVPGATWTHLEVKGIPMDAVERPRTTGRRPHEVMQRVYRGFVESRRRPRRVRGSCSARIADGDRRRALPLHRRQGPHRLGRRAAAARRRRRRRDDPRGLPAHQQLLVGDPREVPRAGPRAPRRRTRSTSTSG